MQVQDKVGSVSSIMASADQLCARASKCDFDVAACPQDVDFAYTRAVPSNNLMNKVPTPRFAKCSARKERCDLQRGDVTY